MKQTTTRVIGVALFIAAVLFLIAAYALTGPTGAKQAPKGWCNSGRRPPPACATPTPTPTPVGINVTPSSDLGTAFAQAMASGQPVNCAPGRYELSSTWNWGGGNGFTQPLTLLCPGATFDGNGIQHFLYMSAAFRGEGFRLEGFRPIDSGVLGALASTYVLRDVTIVGSNVYDINAHALYITRASSVTVERLTTSAIWGASIHAYAGEDTDVPGQTISVSDSALQSLHANVINDTGRMTITRTRFGVPTEQHVREGGPAASVVLVDSCKLGNASQFERFGNVTGALPTCP